MDMTNTYTTLKRHLAARPTAEFRRRYAEAAKAKRGESTQRKA